MTTAPALRPCPFCGGAAQSYESSLVDGWHQVECRQCQATSGYWQTEAQAIAAWNARPGGDDLQSAIDTAYCELAALLADPVTTQPSWPTLNDADRDCLTRAYNTLRTLRTQGASHD